MEKRQKEKNETAKWKDGKQGYPLPLLSLTFHALQHDLSADDEAFERLEMLVGCAFEGIDDEVRGFDPRSYLFAGGLRDPF